MKKWIALLLSLAMLFAFAAPAGAEGAGNEDAPADSLEDENYTVDGLEDAEDPDAEEASAVFQLRNATGEELVSLSVTDNVTGEAEDLLPEEDILPAGEFMSVLVFAEPGGTQLQGRYTLSFETESGFSGSYPSLDFADALVDILSAAEGGANPFRISSALLQTGNYLVVNNTSRVLEQITVTEKATGVSSVFDCLADPGMESYLEFTIDSGNTPDKALRIVFSFQGGPECSYDTLSIEDVSLTLTDDTITGATPFIFGAMDAGE